MSSPTTTTGTSTSMPRRPARSSQNLTGAPAANFLLHAGDVHARRSAARAVREFLSGRVSEDAELPGDLRPASSDASMSKFRPGVGLGGLLAGPATTRLHSRMDRHGENPSMWGAVTFLLPSPRLRGEGSGVRGKPSCTTRVRPHPRPLSRKRARGDAIQGSRARCTDRQSRHHEILTNCLFRPRPPGTIVAAR